MGGGRKRRKQGVGASGAVWEPPEEPVTRSIACHPDGTHVVLVAGKKLRGLDTRSGEVFLIGSEPHENIRIAAFSACGRWLLTGGDDKCFRIWMVDSWDSCINTFHINKKVSAGAFTSDGTHCIVGDKFGDVHCGAVDLKNESPPCTVLLGHYCSVITSVAIPKNGSSVVTTDRDNKVRSSVLPENPLLGSFEVNAYCMGHSAFVTCSCFAYWDDQEILITGGGDGKILLWKHEDGQLLGRFQVPPQNQGESGSLEELPEVEATGGDEPSEEYDEGGCQEEDAVAAGGSGSKAFGSEEKLPKGELQMVSGNVIVAVSPAVNSRHVAVVVDGCMEIWILDCDTSNWEVSLKQKLQLPNIASPTDVSFDIKGRLWVIGGPSSVQSGEIHLGVARMDGDAVFMDCTNGEIPENVLEELECRAGEHELDGEMKKVASISQTLGKREYMDADARKKLRADKKDTEIMLEKGKKI